LTVYVDADVSQTMMKNNADRMQNLIDNFFADCGMIVAQSTKNAL